jgi:hypothetical protein
MNDATQKGTIAWLAWQAKHAREQGTLIVLTPDEADAIVRAADIGVESETEGDRRF